MRAWSVRGACACPVRVTGKPARGTSRAGRKRTADSPRRSHLLARAVLGKKGTIMSSLFEYALIGATLIALGSVGLARAATYFRRVDTGADRFFSTSLTAVAIVGLLTSGVFCMGWSVIELPRPWNVVAGLIAAGYAIVLPFVVWRLLGPRTPFEAHEAHLSNLS